MKKGVFFTIDGIIAAGIIFVVIISASSSYVKEQPNFHVSYISRDVVSILSALNVAEASNGYINERIASGDIENMDNTLLEQIAEFWAKGQLEYANKTVSNVTDLFIPNTMGFGVWIDNEAIYTRDKAITKSLTSSKKIISGIAKGQQTAETRENPPTLFGVVVVEVRVWQ